MFQLLWVQLKQLQVEIIQRLWVTKQLQVVLMSTAMGTQTTASGGRSTAMGKWYNCKCASNSTAMGAGSTASGNNSTAMG